MRAPSRKWLPALVALAPLACGVHRIPGTEIPDNSDTRAVVAAIEAYRQAAERRDAGAVLALVSQAYFDNAGTPDPSDDVDYDHLRLRLASDYQKITALRLDIKVKQVDVTDRKAIAYVIYDEYYRVLTNTGEVAKQASDQNRMRLVREGTAWHFVSGL
jgi:hypothetical protein